MDLREIIKWFIPCFHVLLYRLFKNMDYRLTICLFLFFSCPSFAGKVSRSELVYSDNLNVNYTKNLDLFSEFNNNQHQRDDVRSSDIEYNHNHGRSIGTGRTFGIRFRKMMQALIPLAFQLGSAATWTVVAALVGVKTLAVTLVILKLLLLAGAVKMGALFASHKSHDHDHKEWSPHQKEIHLHIHNGAGYHSDEHSVISPWSREGTQESKHVNVVADPYAAGPQTISTPYGNYMKIESGTHVRQ